MRRIVAIAQERTVRLRDFGELTHAIVLVLRKFTADVARNQAAANIVSEHGNQPVGIGDQARPAMRIVVAEAGDVSQRVGHCDEVTGAVEIIGGRIGHICAWTSDDLPGQQAGHAARIRVGVGPGARRTAGRAIEALEAGGVGGRLHALADQIPLRVVSQRRDALGLGDHYREAECRVPLRGDRAR